MMPAVHTGLAGDAVSRVSHRPAKLHILAGFEPLVESTDLLEDGAADREIPGSEPLDVTAIGRPGSQRVVHSLHPGRVDRRTIGITRPTDGRVVKCARARPDPTGPDLVVGIYERENVAGRRGSAYVTARAHPQAGAIYDPCAEPS